MDIDVFKHGLRALGKTIEKSINDLNEANDKQDRLEIIMGSDFGSVAAVRKILKVADMTIDEAVETVFEIKESHGIEGLLWDLTENVFVSLQQLKNESKSDFNLELLMDDFLTIGVGEDDEAIQEIHDSKSFKVYADKLKSIMNYRRLEILSKD